jgi:hypothetical protein
MLLKSGGTVHERIHQLEGLVISLIRQDTTSAARAATGSISTSEPPHGSTGEQVNTEIYQTTLDSHALQPPPLSGTAPNTFLASAIDDEANANSSSVQLDGGCMKFDSSGTANYVGSSHWAAVLNSIAELKEHFEQEEEMRNMCSGLDSPDCVRSSWPQLLYSSQGITKAEILSNIPPRRAVDRLVSRYFSLEIASGISTTPTSRRV